jgi:hypothetical protein
MRRSFLLAAILISFMAARAEASLISFTPDSEPSVAVSLTLQPLAPGGLLGTHYATFGVDFSYRNAEGIFSDPPNAFGGVNGSGVIDMLAAVDGRIVVPGTLGQGVTDYFYAEAGYAAVGNLELSVYGIAHQLLGTAFNNLPKGQFGRTTFAISTPGIAYFSITSPGEDTYGVDEIRLDTPTAVPELGSWAMTIIGFAGVGLRLHRRIVALVA